MPAIEVTPPYHPLHFDAQAPVLYFCGRSLSADKWHNNAADMIRDSSRRSNKLLYAANQFEVDAATRTSHVYDEWRGFYRQRAIESGCVLVWLSSAKVGASRGDEINSLLDLKRENPELKIVFGAGIRCTNGQMYSLRDELTPLDISLHASLRQTCQAAVEQITAA